MTPPAEFERQIVQELGIPAEQLASNEIAQRVLRRLVELEFSTRPRAGVTIEAMQTCDDHADPLWKQRFDDAVLAVARRRAELTSDDVLAHVERLADPPKTHNLAAIGPAMIRAMKADIIEPTGRTQRSERPEKHGNRQNVWRSRVFNTGGQKCLF